MTSCPECNAKLTALRSILSLWDRLFCESCGAELEVVAVDPLELEVLYDFDDAGILLDALEMDVQALDWEAAAEPSTNDKLQD